MAKDPEKPQKTDEEEIFEQYGITDEDDKARARVFAAARALHSKRSVPSRPEKKSRWGNE